MSFESAGEIRAVPPEPCYFVSPATYADILADLLMFEVRGQRRRHRAALYLAAIFATGREPDVRRLYGWTRKRWVRERRRYNGRRGWKTPWAEHVQQLAARGDAPWYRRNSPEAREVRRRLG